MSSRTPARPAGRAVLSLRDVTYSYRQTRALDGVSLDLTDGVCALVGVNGAGKTTLLTAASGGLRPATGSVTVDGLDVYGRATRRQALGKVALMPQSATFPGSMTVREVVEYLTWMRGASAREARLAAQDAIARVLLADRASSRVSSLSGGMVRRLCLAQALAADADVLLLDEPSTGLDPEQRSVMVDLLREVRGAVLLSSHVMEDITDLADRVLVLDAGTLVFDGTVGELEGLAPATDGVRAAEAGFLAVLTGRRAGRS